MITHPRFVAVVADVVIVDRTQQQPKQKQNTKSDI